MGTSVENADTTGAMVRAEEWQAIISAGDGAAAAFNILTKEKSEHLHHLILQASRRSSRGLTLTFLGRFIEIHLITRGRSEPTHAVTVEPPRHREFELTRILVRKLPLSSPTMLQSIAGQSNTVL